MAASSNANLQAPAGSTLTLDGSGSTAQDSITSYVWSVSSRPAGSTATLQDANAAVASFVPDVPGNYQFSLQIGAGGTTANAVLAVAVTAAVPVVNVNAAFTFTGPVTNHPAQTVSLGAMLSLDASGSTDGAGNPATATFAVVSAPTGSRAALNVNGNVANLTPDLAGTYQVRVRATSQAGLYGDAIYTFNVAAAAPTVVVATSVAVVGTNTSLAAAVGNLVSLDAAASSVPSGNGQGSWTIGQVPAGSSMSQLTTVSATAVSFVPDVPGTYLLQYTLVDTATNVTSFERVTVNTAFGPTAVVTATANPVVQATAPSYVGAIGGKITLQGNGSYDPNGQNLTYSWVMSARPAGSTASITGAASATPSFTPDVDGLYSVTLTVTNSSGLSAAQLVNVSVGHLPPVVVLDRTQIAVLLGGSVSASAAGSYSQNNDPLAFHWSLNSAPPGSTVTLANPNSAALSFTPDVAGTYFASVTVTDGPVSAVSGVSILVLSPTGGSLPLTYQPLFAGFSKSQNTAVIVSTNPNALHLVNPAAGSDIAIALPAAVKSMSLSADGTLAGVLHEGSVSLVDLVGKALIHTSATGGSQTDVFTANSGVLWVTGQTGGQWVSPPIESINGRTGATIATGGGFAQIYGSTFGVLSESLDRIYTLSNGLSPMEIYWDGVDPVGGTFSGSNGQAPYWGTYGMSNPMWLASDDSLLFTSSGTYFRTSDLGYQGTLGTFVQSLSHSASASEVVVLAASNVAVQYPSVLKYFTGSLLLPSPDVQLPMIAGQQAYGMWVFHDANDKLVIVAQVGSNLPQASGLQYFLVVR